MFGLEKEGKNKKPEEFVFDFEKDVNDPKRKEKFMEHILDRIQTLKKALREGEKQENIDQLGTLLYGYIALQKVSERVQTTKKT